MKEKLPIVESFYSLQGEGSEVGKPSIFIRLGGCNLTCKGFGNKCKSALTNEELVGCDSHFAVNVKHFKNTWDYVESYNELVSIIESKYNGEDIYMKPIIIFTGGEPLIHKENKILIDTLEYYTSRGYEVWFETNGTQNIDFIKYPIYKKVDFVISPKLSNSGESKSKTFHPEICNNLIINTKNSSLKFVIDNSIENEIEEYLESIPTYAKVFVMPKGGTIKELEQNASYAFEYALKNGLYYSDRIHIRVFDDKQGV